MKRVRWPVTVPGFRTAPALAAGLAVVSALLVLALVRPASAGEDVRIVRDPVFVDLGVGSLSTALSEAPCDQAFISSAIMESNTSKEVPSESYEER